MKMWLKAPGKIGKRTVNHAVKEIHCFNFKRFIKKKSLVKFNKGGQNTLFSQCTSKRPVFKYIRKRVQLKCIISTMLATFYTDI